MRTLAKRLGLLKRDQDGSAVVEFALILPFLLLLFLGSIEASSLITVDRRVNVISGTLGDLVARSEDSIAATTITDYFTAAQNIIYPYPAGDLEQRVSFVEVAADGTTKVLWSCAYNGATARTVNSAYTLPTKMNELSRGGWIVASETRYAYTPVLGVIFDDVFNLTSESFYLPRFEEAIVGPGTC
jgi:Flp pilus assembly protein TadG